MIRFQEKIICCLFITISSFMPSLSWALDDGFSVGRKIETRHFTVLIESGVSEESLIRSLDMSSVFGIISGSITGGSSYSPSSLSDLLDALFNWDCRILDMPLYSYKGTIKIARDQQEIKSIFMKLYGQPGFSNKSFFIQEINTIYIASTDFTKEILAHEMGHAIMGSFFVVQPPDKIAEVLAGYVEYQLRKISNPR
jgi:hypothetical protein